MPNPPRYYFRSLAPHRGLAALRTLLPTLLLALAGSLPAAGGELGLAHESHPEEGLVAAGQPTAEQIAQLAAAGFKSVIDLRGEAEDRGFDEAGAVAEAGMEYLSVPVTSQGLDESTFERVFAALAEAERPLLLHCASSNRVGALYAAYLAARRDVPLEEALERGREAGLRSPELADKVRAFLQARAGAGEADSP